MNDTIDTQKVLKVLVVDDTPTNRTILQLFLTKLKMKVVTAENGALAIDAYERESPDIIIMDVMMPVMDGFEATRRIKALAGNRWVPVVFLSALDKEENLVAGLDAGGDDYLPKPVNFVVLEAKMRSLTRSLALQRALDENAKRLQTYHDTREAEAALALRIMTRQMQRKGLKDSCVQHWLTPAENFSGDIVAANRSPNGKLYAMLADATGHGLGAAICTLPVLTLFYGMTEIGAELNQIVHEINNQLNGTLPIGHFVAASIVSITPDGTGAEVWNGGTPHTFLISADGKLKQTFESNSAPMGIIPMSLPEIETQFVKLEPEDQFILFSDGLSEATNAEGVDFGYDRMIASFSEVPPDNRIEAIQTALKQHLGEVKPHDDVSLLAVTARNSAK
jgi:CheY-like chemotaxis protein